MLTTPDPDDPDVDHCKKRDKYDEKDETWYSGPLPDTLCDASLFRSKSTLIEQGLRSFWGLITSYKACNLELGKYPQDLCHRHVHTCVEINGSSCCITVLQYSFV